jgi:hypothetical protein
MELDMVSLWGLFRRFEDAQAAVAELQGRGFDPPDISAILLEETARPFLHRDAAVEVTQAHVKKQPPPPGLDKLLVEHRPVRVPDTGPLLVTGTLGALLAETATNAKSGSGGLAGALVDFGILEPRAHLYTEGVIAGQVLLAVRADNEREREAVSILTRHKASELGGFPG